MKQLKTELILAIAIAILLAVSAILVIKLVNAKHDANNYEHAIKISRDSTTHYKNKYGETVAKTMVMELTTSQLQRNVSELGIDNTILKTQVKRMSDLVSIYQSKSITKGDIITVMHDSVAYVKGKDSVVYKDFDYNGKYLSLRGRYEPKNDSVYIQYRHMTPISIAVVKQSDGLFKGYHFEATAVAEDPNTYFDNQKVVMIKSNTPVLQSTSAKMIYGIIIGFFIGKL